MDDAIKRIESMVESYIKTNDSNKKIIVATLGGDGSLGCTLDVLEQKSEFIMSNIDKIHFATLPYGSGNDLSRSLGWGGDVS
mmetsp:Transcript_18835/g.26041  ORF Transcript_18835/g.26041 Transcript_18835/m.26041 type:complete len:82 (+) Transcript_18835:443-688(+)